MKIQALILFWIVVVSMIFGYVLGQYRYESFVMEKAGLETQFRMRGSNYYCRLDARLPQMERPIKLSMGD